MGHIAVPAILTQQSLWDMLEAKSVIIEPAVVTPPVAGWERLDAKSLVIQPAVVVPPPPTGWERLDAKSIVIQLAGAPPPTGYILTLAVTPANSGTVVASPVKATYSSGDVVKLTATPATGYLFDYWDAGGTWLSNANPLSYTIKANVKITAHFRSTGAAPTPAPTPSEGLSPWVIIGGAGLLGGIFIVAGTRKRRK